MEELTMLKNTNYVIKFDNNGFAKKSLTYNELTKEWELITRIDKNNCRVEVIRRLYKHKDFDIFIENCDFHNMEKFNINTNRVVTTLKDNVTGIGYAIRYQNKVLYLRDFLSMYDIMHFVK
jgi:hypothetical protein